MSVERIRAAGLLVYRRSNGVPQYLLLQASYPPFHWSPPKGHLDSGEDERAAALRETFEEAGIPPNILRIHEDFCEVLKYQVKISRYQEEVTKDKTVKYWLARLMDDNTVKLSAEHQNLKWAAVEEAVKLVQFEDISALINKANDYLKAKES